MAVAKMQRLVLLMETSTQSELLKTVQEFQAFEPIDLSTSGHKRLTFDEGQAKLQNVESQLAEVRKAQAYLKPFLGKQRPAERWRLTAQAFADKITAIKERDVLGQVQALQAREQELAKALKVVEEELAILSQWRNLSLLPNDVKSFRAVDVLVGTLPEAATQSAYQQLLAISEIDFYVERLFQNSWEVGVAIYVHHSDKEQLESLLTPLQFNLFQYPYSHLPKAQEALLLEKRDELLAAQKQGVKELKALGHFYTDLLLLEEELYNQGERNRADLLLLSGEAVSALSGWVTAHQLVDLQELLAATLPRDSYVCLLDEAEGNDKDVPIVLTNHPLVEPFELLTEMYSLPKYTEIDPTPLLAPFYAVFFGMMVADVGYGLVMLLGTWYLLTKTKASKGMRKNYKLFHLLSYPTILWGFFFGSLFGVELPFHVLSTTTDVISILVLSVVFGLVQLLFGLMVNTQIQLKERNYPSALSDGLGWIGLLVGIILLLVQQMTGLAGWGELAKWLIIANVLMIVLGTAAGSEHKLFGIGAGLYKLYGATSYIGDIASYTRLMALCVSGASIAASFNMVVGLLPAGARFTVGIPLILALQLLNFGMSLLGAYVHAVRLQFVEFFGKFYEGGGRAFNPLKTYEKYTDLETRKLEK